MERDFMARLQVVGLEAIPLTVAIFDDLINRDSGRRAELVKFSGAKAEQCGVRE
jgi:hypothetical protein